jgi:hypothetical protein
MHFPGRLFCFRFNRCLIKCCWRVLGSPCWGAQVDTGTRRAAMVRLAQRRVDDVAAQAGREAPEILPLLQELGQLQHEAGDFGSAEETCRRVQALTAQVPALDEPARMTCVALHVDLPPPWNQCCCCCRALTTFFRLRVCALLVCHFA